MYTLSLLPPPSASDETLETVAKLGGGYTYLLSRAGVTGAETKAGMPVAQLLERLHQFDAPPAILGFGISEPAQVKEAIQAGAAGAISGSATVKLIEQHQNTPDALLAALSSFTESMKQATKK